MRGVPGTGTTYGKKDGWGQSGQLITGNSTSQVTMQAAFDEPGTYTVQFSKTDNPSSNNPIYAVATITWSVEGNYLTRQVNVGDGVSVSGVGQSVRVIMQDATPALDGEPNGVTYNVAVQVSKGVRGTSKQPPTLIAGTPSAATAGGAGAGGVYTLPAGATVTIPVPSAAGIIAAYITMLAVGAQPALGETTVTFTYGSAFFPTKTYDPRMFPDWVPITPGTDALILDNTSGSQTSWSVAFGIDG